ncbi:alpha/beta fold hydrolase [Hymenobacter koreensis]|uniref:Alpha/beta fold hydrolase n=1 Tax=Hymenobacter koreensis TaxID=1084523 RepID=A0ABP8IXT0_9BACT
MLLASTGAWAENIALDGQWKGPLKVPGGQWEVIFRVVTLTGGKYHATMDVPLQRVNRMSVAVEMQGDSVVFSAEEAGSRYTGIISPDGKQVKGVWRQPGYKAPLTLQLVAAGARSETKVRLTPPYRENEVTFSAAAEPMSGMLTVPPGAGPFPTVVLVADAGSIDRDATVGEYRPLGALADYLTRRGVAVLRVDAKPGAPLPTLPQRVVEVQAALNYLRTRPEVDFARLGLIGHGEGGNVALLVAAQPLPPSFVVTMAAAGQPGSSLVVERQAAILRSLGTNAAQIEAAVKRQEALVEVIRQAPDAAQAQAMVANMLRQNNASMDAATALASAAQLTSSHYRHFLAFDPVEKLNQVTCPVLLLNGAADLHVAPENLLALTKGLKANKHVTSKKLPGVNHLFQADPAEWPLINGQPREIFSPQAQEIIRAWVLQQGKP